MNTTYTVNVSENLYHEYEYTYASALTEAINILSQLRGIEFPSGAMTADQNGELVPATYDLYDHIVGKLEKLREQQTKRGNYVSKAEAAKQEANAGYAQVVLAVLADGAKMTVSDMMAASDELGDLSNQKVTAVVKSLLDAGQVVKTVEKRKAFFALAA